jgi:hypothetical protein
MAAANGTQGDLTAGRDILDLILATWASPNGGGNYVLGKLKANPQAEPISVVVLTMKLTQGSIDAIWRTVLKRCSVNPYADASCSWKWNAAFRYRSGL